jgi:hypothetical protein
MSVWKNDYSTWMRSTFDWFVFEVDEKGGEEDKDARETSVGHGGDGGVQVCSVHV